MLVLGTGGPTFLPKGVIHLGRRQVSWLPVMCRPTPSRSSWESVADVGDATTNGPSTGHSGGTAADLHCLPYSSAAVQQRTPAPLFDLAIKRAALKSVKSAPFQKQFSQHLFLWRSLFSAEYSSPILLVQLLIMADEFAPGHSQLLRISSGGWLELDLSHLQRAQTSSSSPRSSKGVTRVGTNRPSRPFIVRIWLSWMTEYC